MLEGVNQIHRCVAGLLACNRRWISSWVVILVLNGPWSHSLRCKFGSKNHNERFPGNTYSH